MFSAKGLQLAYSRLKKGGVSAPNRTGNASYASLVGELLKNLWTEAFSSECLTMCETQSLGEY